MREQNRILVLYGSQTFTAQEVAERVWRKTKALGFRGPVQAMDDYPISRLIHENFVIFVCSTTGQGDEPDNMKKFWKFLLRKSLPPNSLMTLRFGVVGLGDSSYEKFNFAGKKLHKRLKQLGATPLLDIGLCDYQHDLGHDAVLTPWLDQLFIKLKCYFPNLQTDNMNDTFIPKWKVSIIKKEIPVVLDSEYEDIYFARGQKSYYLEANLLKVTKNIRTTEETHFQTKDDKAKCDLCHSLYSVKGGSTTNLKKHLMKKHRSSYETIIPCSMSDEAVLEAPIPSTSASTESTNPVIKKK
ncbi:unnamed protein product [Parnassius apollo]|uniref:(apollo) hypothetical protein n=1 Tax=Parnassius apollo TaxID=110799 RepID=A0A8S3XHH0_PARAO|nr:unnamed protein product [Parnassius apollo]